MKDINKEEQKNLAEDCSKLALALNDKYFLINSHWYHQWANFVDYKKHFSGTPEHPGVINNQGLLSFDGSLKDDILLDQDYYLVHERLWNMLKSSYGIQNEQV